MSQITPDQASFIIGCIQFIFALSLIPTIFNPKAQVPRTTSGLTAGGLWVIALSYLAMGPLWFAFQASSICALAWTIIFIERPVRIPMVESICSCGGDYLCPVHDAMPRRREGFIDKAVIDKLPTCTNVPGCVTSNGVMSHGANCALAVAFRDQFSVVRTLSE